MLDLKTSKSSSVFLREAISAAFPSCNVSQVCAFLRQFDEAYTVAAYDLALYYLVTTPEVIDRLNDHQVGGFWRILVDAVFDRGISELWQFFDHRSDTFRNLQQRGEAIFGRTIFQTSPQLCQELKNYRHQRIAHVGKGFYQKNLAIAWDTPLILLEQIRLGRQSFDQLLGYDINLYTSDFFLSNTSWQQDSLATLLNDKSIDFNRAYTQLAEYYQYIQKQAIQALS